MAPAIARTSADPFSNFPCDMPIKSSRYERSSLFKNLDGNPRSGDLVWRIRNSPHLGAELASEIRIQKPHEQSIDPSVVLKFELPNRGCHADTRNFKFTTLGQFRRRGALDLARRPHILGKRRDGFQGGPGDIGVIFAPGVECG